MRNPGCPAGGGCHVHVQHSKRSGGCRRTAARPAAANRLTEPPCRLAALPPHRPTGRPTDRIPHRLHTLPARSTLTYVEPAEEEEGSGATAGSGNGSDSKGAGAGKAAVTAATGAAASGKRRPRPPPGAPEWTLADVEGATLMLWQIIGGHQALLGTGQCRARGRPGREGGQGGRGVRDGSGARAGENEPLGWVRW